MAHDGYYDLAKERIKAAKLSKELELSFFMLELSELPESIGQLENLKVLDLSYNRLTSLPESMSNLTRLEVLDLDLNRLRVLPDWLSTFTKLKDLSIVLHGLNPLPEMIGQFRELERLDISYIVGSEDDQLILPKSFSNLTNLQYLSLAGNNLPELPEILEHFKNLKGLVISGNRLTMLPDWIGEFARLREINVNGNQLTYLPESIGKLKSLRKLVLGGPDTGTRFMFSAESGKNQLGTLPDSMVNLFQLEELELDNNPLDPELAKAYEQGIDAVKVYLRAKAQGRMILNEAKLILIGEGKVGKTCLMDALLDKPWQEHPTTHGIEIREIQVIDYEIVEHEGRKVRNKINKAITLNGWDFGGQRVYRPTHQLFFSAPAVYLVIWKPREGPQQGFVKEWIQLVKRREPSAKIIIVATHGGPQQRQPDIDRQELRDLFGKDTVVDFFFVDSKPDERGIRKGIEELKLTIAKVAAELPEVGRSVPKSFHDVREALQACNVPYLPLAEVLAICHRHKMDDEIAELFIKISHRLGHLTYYENDPVLQNIVILRPDWLATAMSYVLDDEETRKKHGLVDFSRLGQLWNDPSRPTETRYPENLHKIFLKLMERFDLSYRVAGISPDEEENPVSLIAQLVPDNSPEEGEFNKGWLPELEVGDIEQTQICRIVDDKNQSANAEGLFYQLIVRLHKYSLGRVNYKDSIHWQRGLVLDANYNGRALLRHIGNDVHITVRAPYTERFLGMLTEEVKYLVESFWEGLRCDVTVPCLNENPCSGLFEVEKLIENKKRGRPEQPCPICNEWQNIDRLLSNAPAAAKQISLDTLIQEFSQVRDVLSQVNDNTRRILSQVDKQYADLIRLFTDEAKEGPRLFSIFPLEGNKFNPQTWMRAQFRLVLWCEHSRLPLPVLNNGDMKKGVYDFEFDREWFKQAAPYLKFLAGTLCLVLPVASSTLKVVNDTAFKALENQFSLGKNVIDAMAGTGSAFGEIMGDTDLNNLENGIGIRAENSTLRELHTLLKAKDPGFGGLVRVMNKRQEFMWVHERFAGEY